LQIELTVSKTKTMAIKNCCWSNKWRSKLFVWK